MSMAVKWYAFRFRKFLLLVVFVLAGSVQVLCSCAGSMIFYPPSPSYSDGPDILKIQTAGRQRISAVYEPNTASPFVLLFSHGNAEDIGQNRFFFQQCREHGFGVLAYDYRGYGTSDGKSTEQNTYEDIESAYNYLVHMLKTDPNHILIHGRSVGSGPSCWLASRKPAAGLILESPFLSAYRVALPVSSVPFDKYDNLSRIGDIHCPVLIIHGRQDTVVPFFHGAQLYEKANEPKMHYWVPDANHNDLLYRAGDVYWKKLREFIKLIHSNHITERAK